MLLTINAPHVERRLRSAAQAQNTTPAELAQRLLEASLPETPAHAETPAHEASGGAEALSSAQRKERLHRYVEANRQLNVPSLPDEAFERESFYEDERHLRPADPAR